MMLPFCERIIQTDSRSRYDEDPKFTPVFSLVNTRTASPQFSPWKGGANAITAQAILAVLSVPRIERVGERGEGWDVGREGTRTRDETEVTAWAEVPIAGRIYI